MYSMTGFGRGIAEQDGCTLTVELKSVNHRYLDVSIRSPRTLSSYDDFVRKLLVSKLSRGHIDVSLNYRNESAGAKVVTVDQGLLKAYLDAYEGVKSALPQLGDDITVSGMCALPGVMQAGEAPNDENMIAQLLGSAIDDAASELINARAAEGERLKGDMEHRVSLISEELETVELRAPDVVTEAMDRLRQRVQELIGDASVDEGRLVNELAVFSDRCNVTEEIVRLRSHLCAFGELFASVEPCGRKLDFLVQELNREANTIGSKANDIEITNAVLSIKGEIEKLREQVQNIE